jgi:GH25 family lysozyme M1 (1,4-beta-N-acetylmuramidase)
MLRGVDVSEHQGDIDWEAVRRAGIRFAGVKATEGEDFVDPRFGEGRVRAMRAAGIALMPYHYLRFRTDRRGKVEAEHCLRTIRKAGWRLGRDIPLAVDLEVINNEPMLRRMGPGGARAYATDFCRFIKEKTGRGCLSYLSPGFASRIGNAHPINGAASWVADWDAPDGKPHVPAGYSRGSIYFHQTAGGERDKTRVRGIPSVVDLDVFLGDEDRLQRLVAGKRP